MISYRHGSRKECLQLFLGRLRRAPETSKGRTPGQRHGHNVHPDPGSHKPAMKSLGP